MKFVLIVILSASGGGGMNTWKQPGIAMATFDDFAACKQGAEVARMLAKDSNLAYGDVKAACVATQREAVPEPKKD